MAPRLGLMPRPAHVADDTYDAIVIGAGPNGLVAANHLLDQAGRCWCWRHSRTSGGAVRSDSDVPTGFVHDTFSAFYPLAAASPNDPGLRARGARLALGPRPSRAGPPRADGSWALLHRDRNVTAELMDDATPRRRRRVAQLCQDWDRIGDHLVHALFVPVPPVRAGLGAAARLRSVGGMDFVRTLLSPATELGRDRFGGGSPRLLLAGNAGARRHPARRSRLRLDGAAAVMLGQTVGFPVPEGGAGSLTQALARSIESLGGESGAPRRSPASRSTPGAPPASRRGGRSLRRPPRDHRRRSRLQALRRTVAPEDLPPRTPGQCARFQLDPSTVKVDWALDGPVPWSSPPPYAPGHRAHRGLRSTR